MDSLSVGMAHLVMARSVGARLDPALLGRLDLLLVAAAVPAHLPSPVGVVRVRGGRWGPAVLLVRGQLGELDNELELTPAAVGGRGSTAAAVGAGIGAGRLRRRPPLPRAGGRRRRRGGEREEVVDERAGGGGGGSARAERAAGRRRRRRRAAAAVVVVEHLGRGGGDPLARGLVEVPLRRRRRRRRPRYGCLPACCRPRLGFLGVWFAWLLFLARLSFFFLPLSFLRLLLLV